MMIINDVHFLLTTLFSPLPLLLILKITSMLLIQKMVQLERFPVQDKYPPFPDHLLEHQEKNGEMRSRLYRRLD